MVFLFEQIAVEAAMIIATLVATACFLVVVLGFVLQHRAQRNAASTAGPVAHDRLIADRAACSLSTFTPSHN